MTGLNTDNFTRGTSESRPRIGKKCRTDKREVAEARFER